MGNLVPQGEEAGNASRRQITGLFMDKMVVFVKLYFPVFLLGAVFGKVHRAVAVDGLARRQSYKDIFAITCIKTLSVFVVIAVHYLTGIV